MLQLLLALYSSVCTGTKPNVSRVATRFFNTPKGFVEAPLTPFFPLHIHFRDFWPFWGKIGENPGFWGDFAENTTIDKISIFSNN